MYYDKVDEMAEETKKSSQEIVNLESYLKEALKAKEGNRFNHSFYISL